MEDLRRFQHPLGCLTGDNPCPISAALERNQVEEVPFANPMHPITPVFPHLDQTVVVTHKSRITYVYQRHQTLQLKVKS